ncbi:MAG: hypothetical protein ACJA09_002934 [Alcanivorax sp.]|jgi:hypothetical protein
MAVRYAPKSKPATSGIATGLLSRTALYRAEDIDHEPDSGQAAICSLGIKILPQNTARLICRQKNEHDSK